MTLTTKKTLLSRGGESKLRRRRGISFWFAPTTRPPGLDP